MQRLLAPSFRLMSPLLRGETPKGVADSKPRNLLMKIETVLNHKNWTGLSLMELIHAGRINPSSTEIIMAFVRESLGNAKNMAELMEQKQIAKTISQMEVEA